MRHASADIEPTKVTKITEIEIKDSHHENEWKNCLRPIFAHFKTWWTLEVCCLIISIFLLTTNVFILLYYDGKSIPNWPFGITLNAFMSITSGIAKSALLFATVEALGQLKWSYIKERPDRLKSLEWFDMASRAHWRHSEP
ncbi:hypothetical protein N0V90_009525 [Kalmusia sp. IMI 367209]|nr:hypothetical protein N0V90_009525 [Kalmusia sp. IMI 367209]